MKKSRNIKKTLIPILIIVFGIVVFQGFKKGDDFKIAKSLATRSEIVRISAACKQL